MQDITDLFVFLRREELSGVYIICRGEKVLYVGQSKNVFIRTIRQSGLLVVDGDSHGGRGYAMKLAEEFSKAPDELKIYYQSAKTKFERTVWEDYYISKLNPVFNKNRLYWDDNPDDQELFRRIVEHVRRRKTWNHINPEDFRWS